MISETGFMRLNQTVRTPAIMVNKHYGKWIHASGLMIAPKVFTIIHGMELGKPVAPPNIMGRSFVRSDNNAEGRG
jgi:hypothetical protein